MEISELYKIFKQYPSVSTDSRKIQKDSMFFALKGENFDGNLYAQTALDSGASYCIVDNPKYAVNQQCILVDDVLKTLQLLANFHRKQFSIPFIGVTGSNGKTTTKELISRVLSKKYKTAFTQGNLNNHIGVPLTLLSVTSEHEIAVIEMGANHQGEIAALCEIAEPTHGIITNVGKDHLEGFGSPEGVIKTKNELYQSLAKQKGTIFVNGNNEILMNLAKNQNHIVYGTDTNVSCKGYFIDANPFVKLKWTFNSTKNIDNISITESQLAGKYNFENILAAVCIGNFFGVSQNAINEAIAEYKPTNNRSQLTKTATNTLLLDAYNANPSSMEVAIDNFVTLNVTNKVLILGDMLELGSYSQAEHQAVYEKVRGNDFKQTLLIGKCFSELTISEIDKEKIKQFENCGDLCKFLSINKITDSYILVKGSRGIKLEQCVEHL